MISLVAKDIDDNSDNPTSTIVDQGSMPLVKATLVIVPPPCMQSYPYVLSRTTSTRLTMYLVLGTWEEQLEE